MSTGVTGQYLCNQCGQTVTLTPHPSTSSALICPNCTSTFLELLIQNPNPTENSIDSDQFDLFDVISAGIGNSAADGVIELWPPTDLLRDYVGPFAAMIDEYRINRNGNPPAARAVVEGLSSLTISEDMVGNGVSLCAICKESFCVGDVAKELPCKHVYHCDCVLPWLGFRNSCPLCRFELPTDDVEYENMGRGASSSEGSNSRDGNNGRGNGNAAGGSFNEDID